MFYKCVMHILELIFITKFNLQPFQTVNSARVGVRYGVGERNLRGNFVQDFPFAKCSILSNPVSGGRTSCFGAALRIS
ncbi:MAG: hypothetical protein EBR81_08390 [Proteobacteria bacterium]|nr:hypothetical protein [Pseudomonadota bacterium]